MAALLAFFEENPEAKWKAEESAAPDTTAAEIDALVREGSLFAADAPEETVTPERRGAVIKALCLHAAHDCNLRCAYCFADTGGYSGPRGLLPLETGQRAIDFLLENSGARKNLELDFFGGEPLMNFDVVKALVRYGRKRESAYGKHIRFTVTTNGLLLDDAKTAFINEHMDNAIISLDGRPEINDRLRKTVSGEGSYGFIIENLKRFAQARELAGKLYYVRGTYTKYNRDFAEDVRFLADQGFQNISVEPAVCGGDGGTKGDGPSVPEKSTVPPWALTEADLPALLAEYDRLTELLLAREEEGRPISFFHFNIDLSQGPCVYKRAAGCGAGTEYVAVTPEGDIYPCHQFAGEPGWKLGNVNELAAAGYRGFENRHYDYFNRAHIFSKEGCAGCWAKYYCSGGCHANAVHFEGDILKPHRLSCALERKRVECAIGVLAKRALRDATDK